MTMLRVAGAQMPVTDDIAANVATLERAISFAREQDAALLLTPEGSLSGYTPRFDAAEVQRALAHTTGVAREAGVGLALGTCFVEPEDGHCYNQLRFYDREGAYLGFHAKILRCGTMDEPTKGEINDYATVPLRTFDFHGIPIGGLICNDAWANPTCTPMPDPHLSQQLARMGARAIFVGVFGGRGGTEWSDVSWRFHEANLRMRARAAKIPFVIADSSEPADLRCSVQSGVVGADGLWRFRTRNFGEQFFAWTLDLRARQETTESTRSCGGKAGA